MRAQGPSYAAPTSPQVPKAGSRHAVRGHVRRSIAGSVNGVTVERGAAQQQQQQEDGSDWGEACARHTSACLPCVCAQAALGPTADWAALSEGGTGARSGRTGRRRARSEARVVVAAAQEVARELCWTGPMPATVRRPVHGGPTTRASA